MRISIILVFLFIIVLIILAIEWDVVIDYVDKVTKNVGLKTPAYLLTILEKESSFAKNIGDNTGSKEANIQRCVDYCEELKLNNTKGKNCYDLQLRKEWCTNQYEILKRITSRLGLDINKVPFAKDFGIGYTQFQPTTWESYPELKNKNPWNLEDSIYAAAIKLLKDGIHNNERLAIGRYNGNSEYIDRFIESRQEWDGIISDTIFVFDCKENNFSCGLTRLKTEYDDCTENDWAIKRKKECIKNKVAQLKEIKLANLEREKNNLVIKLTRLQTYNSTAVISAILFPKFQTKEELVIEKRNIQFSQNLPATLNDSKQKITYKEERIKEPQEQIAYKEETRISQQETGPNIEKIEISESSKLFSTTTENISTTTNNITTTTEKVSTTTEKRATSTSPQEKENKPKIIYVSGGFGPPSKNPCDDYKNKNYPNILINEIQFETKTDPKDEFIELYNPNNEEVDLTCWSLEKYASKQNPTSTPTLTKLIPESKFVGKIKPYSFFLITSSSTKEKYQGDLSYAESYSISQNNTIILKKPNDEISDLVGYGDNNEKIYQFEGSPFIASSTKFENKSIQRKNFKDTNNNLDDFWLHKPKPENSSSLSQLPRQDFADLSQIKIENFNIFPTSTEEGTNLNLEWQEPLLGIVTTNYAYEVLISTSTEFNTFKLEDFGTTSSLPLPKFESSTTTFQIEITKCPTTSTLYYFGIYLKDLLDEENKTDLSIASTTLPETLCNPEAEEVVTPTSTTSTVKVLISEVAILEGTSTGEYIELYNPNNFEIDLSGWRLEKINKNGEITVLISSKTRLSTFNNVKIKPYSYLLIANASSFLDILPDLVWSKSHDIAKDNAVRLINDKGEIVDIVGWGSPPLFEGEAFPQNPEENKVLLRKAGINSTENSMANKEKSYGNSYDTDNNKLDFILANPEPQNSFSTSEIPPDYPEEFILRAGGQYLKISFNSPYQKLLNSYYELRVLKNELNDEEIQNNWQSLKKLNVDLPEVGPFGENINIEINACQQGLGDNDILLLGIIHENNLKNFVKAKIKGLDCMIFQSIGSEEFWWGQMGPTYVSKVAQEVLVNKRSFIKNISIQLAKYQNPEDKLWVEIWSEGDKPETGTFLTKTKEIEGSSLTSNTTWVDFTLDQGIILEPGKYFFVLQRSSLNSENFYSSARTIDTDKSSKLWHFLAVEGGWVFYSFYYPPPGPGLITRDLGIQIR